MAVPRNIKFVDAHSHAYEFNSEIANYKGDILILCVSDDLNSSYSTLNLYKKCKCVIPALGVHPWSLDEVSIEEVNKVINLIEKNLDIIKIVGEVGLDKRFRPHTFNIQVKVFEKFLLIAKEYGLALNLHTVGTWEEVLKLLSKFNIENAIFHWYTGPIELIKQIESYEYFISVNAAAKIQPKHRNIIKHVNINNILTESDSPYKYRGLNLTPYSVVDAVKIIAEEKGMEMEEVKRVVFSNFLRMLSRINFNYNKYLNCH